MANERTGLLLVNLGTPASPAPEDVRPYLREFLMDPRVIDVPGWRRWLIVNLLILPFRPKESGKAYEKVWTDRGSPLLFYSEDLRDKVARRVGEGVTVDLAMRYGTPSIPEALDRFRDAGIDRIAVFPLYPQYSSAANGSTQEYVMRMAGERWNVPQLQFIPPFYDHPAFLDPCAEVARPAFDVDQVERVYFSFHGLPERQVRKSDDSGRHCFEGDCCAAVTEVNRNCYRAQCYATARGLADRLGIPDEKRVVCFQSRLGRTPWIRPYTDVVLAEDAAAGVRRAAILSPAFVADCLETIEELGIRALETWQEHGGEELIRVPCVNAADSWADGVVQIAAEQSPWVTASRRSAPEGSPDLADRRSHFPREATP